VSAGLRRVAIRVFGRVQGVGFRYSTEAKARDLALVGWVRNRSDGSVEIVAEGDRESIGLLLEWCRSGPRSARVENVEVAERADGEPLEGFETRW